MLADVVNVPAVNVMAPLLVSAPPSVTVLDGAFTTTTPIVLPFGVTVPVPRKVGTTAVYVPPVASVKLPEMFRVLAAVTVQVLPVKSMLLNQLFAVIVKALAPAVTNKFGALDAEPPVVPKTSVAVAAWFLEKPPVPVQVKPVAIGINNIFVVAVVLDKTMFPEPNAIDRVLVLDELKIPVESVNPARSREPLVRVKVFVAPSVIASASSNPLVASMTTLLIDLPLLVNVVVALIVGANPVYVPPVASVMLPAMLHVPLAVAVLPVKLRFLNHELAVIVNADAPAVTEKFGALVEEPPEPLPNWTVAVAAMFRVNPPVPVQVKFVAVFIDSTVVAAVVLDKTMLPDPNAIDRVRLLFELKIPTVKLLLLSVIVPEVSENVLAAVLSSAEPDKERLTTPPVGLATTVLRATAVEATVTV